MTISVHGIGWLTKEGYGCIRSGLQHAYETGEGARTLPTRDIFSHPFKNFGRLDTISKMTVFGVSLALQDAGIEWGSDPWSPSNRQLNSRKGGRGVYFRDLDGHMLELLTRT